MANNKFDNVVAASPFRDPRLFLIDLLSKHKNVKEAAKASGLSHETLYKKCREHGVSISRKLVATQQIAN